MKDGQERIVFIDLAKGFCIALVVFYHSKGVLHCDYLMDNFLLSFRLPLYFFLSGLFFKDYGSFKRFITKKTNRLLIPFFFFYIIFSVFIPNLLHYTLGMNFETIVGWPSLWAFIWPEEYPNIPIWFLWCLFLMNVLFWLMRYIIMNYVGNNIDGILIILCIVSGITGYCLIDNYHTDYATLFKALQSMPFFYFGYLFNTYNGLHVLQLLSTKKAILHIVTFLIPTIILTVFVSWPTLLTFYICGMTGTIFILLLARVLNYMPLFSYIGRYSIIVLLTHGIIIRLLTPSYNYLSQYISITNTTMLMTVILLLSYYLIIPIMCCYLPFFTAQRPLLREYR